MRNNPAKAGKPETRNLKPLDKHDAGGLHLKTD